MRIASILVFCVACSGSAPVTTEPEHASTAAPSTPAPRPATDLTLEELVAEYVALRAIPGHFGGGVWSDDVDRFGGRKHEIMVELGQRLGDGSHTLSDLDPLGAPDATITGSAPALGGIFDRGAAPFDQLIVFQWRGNHDFLYFQVRGSAIVGHAWWSALE